MTIPFAFTRQTLIATALATTLLAGPATWAADPAPEQKQAMQPRGSSNGNGMGMGAAKGCRGMMNLPMLQQHMTQMREHMQKMKAATTAKERERLMQEHMQMMDDHMGMMMQMHGDVGATSAAPTAGSGQAAEDGDHDHHHD